jgi:hypothetical protein
MRARRLAWAVLVSLCTMLGGLALASAPALAGSAPQAPVTEAASEVKGFSAVLHGELPLGGGASGYYFAYDAGGSCEGGASTEPGTAESGPVHTEVSGLLPLTRYTFCLVASNENGSTYGPEISFETKRAAPAVEGESFSDVGSGSAELSARVNAENTPSEYSFEYATGSEYAADSSYSFTTQAISLGAGHEATGTPAQLTGLAPATQYHFRVVVTNASGETTEGEDVTFRTLPLGILGLPDGRVYERVSPVSNENADVYVPSVFKFALAQSEGIFTQRPFRAAADGDAIAYVADPTSGGAGLGGVELGNDYLATRSPGGGWTQINIQPPGYFNALYQAFSSDLSGGFVGSSSGAPGESGFEEGLPALSPEAPGEGYKILYQHDSSDGSYRPLLTKEASFHLSAGVSGFGQEGTAESTYPLYAGSSADLSESLFETNDALTANAVLGTENTYNHRYLEDNLYISVGGHLSVVNVLPGDSKSEADATFGAPPLLEGLGEDRFDFSNVISADGSRIFWTDLKTGDLYMRENPSQPQSSLDGEGHCTSPGDACTVQIAEGGRFWTATTDGSKVFFTKGDLYEYDVESGLTTDLTPGVEVEGVVGASENGEYIYYVDNGYNLKLWHDGSSTQIATLSQDDGWEDGPFMTTDGYHPQGDWQAGLADRTAEATPGGQGVVFMSNQSLKAVGYPDGYPNNGLYEVYVYEAEDGQLFCASCNPSGEPPQRNEEADAGRQPTAAYLPVSWSAIYQPRLISADGSQVFFDSTEPLVSQDTNGKQDVYEWEREGAGSCREADGCIYLLSGGTGESASWLVDASENGSDVFMVSRTELVPGDPYDSFDLYDARVDGVQPPTPPACSGTGCQGVPPAPPIFATPASVTFDGVGNFLAPSTESKKGSQTKTKSKVKSLTRAQKLAKALKACRERQGRKRTVCEAQARKRYGTGGGLGVNEKPAKGRR